jgi:hypothetical protein
MGMDRVNLKHIGVVICIIIFLFSAAWGKNVSEKPRAFTYKVKPIQNLERIIPKPIDLDSVKKEDQQREREGLPYRFAIPRNVKINPKFKGEWEKINSELLLWRLHIISKGVRHLNFGFTRYRMPSGGRLFIYSADCNQVLGPFTEYDNKEHAQLWTPIINSDDIILELSLPANELQNLELELGSINQGYRSFKNEKALGDSGACNVNVACPEGDLWQDQIRSVAVYTLNGSWTCTGSLINNTSQDDKPFFLTANHCNVNSENAPSMVVYWNFQASTCDGVDASLDQYQTGAIFRASYAPSDFTLVELEDMPSPEYNVYYAGWDRRDAAPLDGVVIHHPSCDMKKISIENDLLSITSYYGNTSPGDGTHLRVADWDVGTTEPGSSGSPFFNEDQKIVGQLHGGNAACGNNASDWFGRLFVSWTGAGTANTSLSDWIDPQNTGVTTLDGKNPTPPLQVNAVAGSHGTIIPSGTILVAQDGSKTFDASPDSGYVVDKWLLDDDIVQYGGNKYTIYNVQSDHTLTVSFKPRAEGTGENNNSYQTAGYLGIIDGYRQYDYDQGLSITSGDVDYYKFTLVNTGTTDDYVEIILKSPSTGEGDSDIDLALGKVNNSGHFVSAHGKWHESMSRSETRIETISLNGRGPGDYYAIVFGASGFDIDTEDSAVNPDFAGSETSDYRLNINAPDYYEDDDTPEQAKAISTDGVAQRHSLSGSDDPDWVVFTLTQDSDVVVQLSANTDIEMDIGLYGPDSFSALIEYKEKSPSTDSCVISRVGSNYLSSGTYYLNVSTWLSNDINQYSLSVTASVATFPPASPTTIDYPSNSNSSQYMVSWSSSNRATGYQLERSNNGGGIWSRIYSGPDTAYSESACNGNYRYRVRATNASGTSDWKTGTWDCILDIPLLYYVDSNSPHEPGSGTTDDPFRHIQDAINSACEGRTVIVYPGRYYENINYNGKNIELTSLDPNDPNIVETTIINGVVTFNNSEDANCKLVGFTITGAGLGINCYQSNPTISHCNITGNNGDGGAYFEDSNAMIENCVITQNSGWLGGISCYFSNISISNCNICMNTCNGYGGGGITNSHGYLWITNCNITGNSGCMGGGIGCGANLETSNCTFMSIHDCNISGNSTHVKEDEGGVWGDIGGGILADTYNQPLEVNIINCLITDNSASSGGGIYFHSEYEEGEVPDISISLSIRDCEISGNSTHFRAKGGLEYDGREGGGIYIQSRSTNEVNIANCVIASNSASWGSGIFSKDTNLMVCNCRITDHYATEWPYYASGILCDGGTPIFCNDLVASNESGIQLNSCSPLIKSSTIVENDNGINLYGDPCATITNCIIADWGYIALYTDNSVPTVLNVSYSDVKGGADNVYQDPDCILIWGPGNIDDDPYFTRLGYWDDNGTPENWEDDFWVEGDYHLLPISLCIDAGDPNYVTDPNETDLDGNPRVINNRIDMGAYEFWGGERSDLNLDGIVNFEDFAILANYWIDHACVEPDWCEKCDYDRSGAVDIEDLKTFAENWLWQAK